MADVTSAETSAKTCCTTEQQATCCEPSAKQDCCGRGEECGCEASSTQSHEAAVRER